MTQNPYTWKHSPNGLMRVKRQTDEAKGQGNSYRPPQQQVSRHRAGHNAGLHPEDAPYITGNQRIYTGVSQSPRARRSKVPADYDNVLVDEEEIDEEEIDGNGDIWPVQIPKSQRYYPQPGQYDQGNTRVNVQRVQTRAKKQSAIPPRSSRQAYEEEEIEEDIEELETQRPPRKRRNVSAHPSLIVGIALVLLLIVSYGGYLGLNAIGTVWQNHQDDVTFGMPRTFQTDAVVGHGDSNSNPSHFIAINLKGSIYVIEAPGGNFSKARSYFITSEVNGNPYPPVTIKFQDLSHSGHLDMVVSVGDPPTPLIVFLFNNGSQFLAKQQ